MKHIKRNLFLILLLACSTSCFAKQISFQVVQHNKCFEEVTEEALFVEDVLISSFFDSGYIVTNSVASVSDSEEAESKLWTVGAKEAIDGGSDIFVQVILSFSEKESNILNKNVMVLENIKYSVHLVDNLFEKGSGSLQCDLKIMDSKDLTVVSGSLVDEIFKVINA